MIDSSGFINNTGQLTSTEVRENIQNKNLLQNKGDLYCGSSVISIGPEGMLFYGKQYSFANHVVPLPSGEGVGVKVRRAVQYTTIESIYENNIIDSWPLSVDFLANGENNIITYQFTLLRDSDYINFAPISFMKKKAFNNFTQINFTQSVNDDHAVYCPWTKYYYYDQSQNQMVEISIASASGFVSAFTTYGFLFTRKLYVIYGYSYQYSYMYKMILDENGVYGVYYLVGKDSWEESQDGRILYTRIK